MDEFKVGDIVVVMESKKIGAFTDAEEVFPLGFITEVFKKPLIGLLIYGFGGYWINLKVSMKCGFVFRHATDREKFLYYTHGQMVLDEI